MHSLSRQRQIVATNAAPPHRTHTDSIGNTTSTISSMAIPLMHLRLLMVFPTVPCLPAPLRPCFFITRDDIYPPSHPLVSSCLARTTSPLAPLSPLPPFDRQASHARHRPLLPLCLSPLVIGGAWRTRKKVSTWCTSA